MKGLVGKVAIVTGATRDMGDAIVGRLAEEGVRVLGIGRNEAGGQAIASRHSTDGKVASFLRVDITNASELAQAVSTVMTRYGRLDIVVNNAAATDLIKAGQNADLVDEPAEVFDQMINVNLRAPYLLAKQAIPHMIQGGGGAFVSLSSIAAQRAIPDMAGYAASKAGLEALTRQIANEYGKHGIRANTILVGSILTSDNATVTQDPQIGAARRSARMLVDPGSVDDMGAMVAFLASEESRFVTGAVIPLDGGAHAKLVTVPAASLYREQAGSG
jgi:NAD(P)-dependent dehydrogenase (short-subunit alcohol dehydrogenase family)